MTSGVIVLPSDLMNAIYGTLPLIAFLDETGQILEANRAAEMLFDYQRTGSMIGLVVEDLVPPTPPELRQRHRQHRALFYQQPQVRMMGARYPLQGWKRTGTAFPVEINLLPTTAARTDGLKRANITIALILEPSGRLGSPLPPSAVTPDT